MFGVSVAGGLAGGGEAGAGGGGGPPDPEVSTDFDEFWDKVVLYTRLDATVPLDLSANAHTLTKAAGAQFDNSVRRLGHASFSLDSSSTGYISASDHADFHIGAEDFAIELWVRFGTNPGATDDSYFVSQWDETGNQRGWALALRNDTVSWRYSTDGQSGTVVELSATWAPADLIWYAVSVERTTGLTKIRVDGKILAAGADAATYHNSTAQLRIGTPVDTADGNFQRNIDEVRFTKGVARYG